MSTPDPQGRTLAEELRLLRDVWDCWENRMGTCDGGEHATLTWAEVTEMHDVTDRVTEHYQRYGYPLKDAS